MQECQSPSEQRLVRGGPPTVCGRRKLDNREEVSHQTEQQAVPEATDSTVRKQLDMVHTNETRLTQKKSENPNDTPKNGGPNDARMPESIRATTRQGCTPDGLWTGGAVCGPPGMEHRRHGNRRC